VGKRTWYDTPENRRTLPWATGLLGSIWQPGRSVRHWLNDRAGLVHASLAGRQLGQLISNVPTDRPTNPGSKLSLSLCSHPARFKHAIASLGTLVMDLQICQHGYQWQRDIKVVLDCM
jgi:hypothetical protein